MPTTNQKILKVLGNKGITVGDIPDIKKMVSRARAAPIVKNSDLLAFYREKISSGLLAANPRLEKMLKKRPVRTMSGIAPVAVLTMPYPCPGKCAYCPTEKNVPQSYLSNEPAVMRAIRCGYDPYKQVQLRLKALENNGHEPTKIELIVIGGTWSVLPVKYKYWYIGKCFEAANKYGTNNKSLKCKLQGYDAKLKIDSLKNFLNIEQAKNEISKYKIVGLTVETRPDYINENELLEMRELGCTRVELGVQAISDEILKMNRRGHAVATVVAATRLLKQYGFKATYHIMPGLPGSTPAKDLKMFKQLFGDERFQPDQIKFYPTVVTKGSLLYKWWKAGKYRPYTEKQLRKLIVECKKIVPPYVRIIRLIRDIPEESIVAGNRITNLRQIVQERGAECKCIRCREVRSGCVRTTVPQGRRGPAGSHGIKLTSLKYCASGGVEYFISYESPDGKILYGFCRLRLPGKTNRTPGKNFPPALMQAALIRELHVYGELAQIGATGRVQHLGLGKNLTAEAEKIASSEGYRKISVISGIGARNYYRKLGYRLSGSYMVKQLI